MSKQYATCTKSVEVGNVDVEVEFDREELLEMLAELDEQADNNESEIKPLAEKVFYQYYGKEIFDDVRKLVSAILGRVMV